MPPLLVLHTETCDVTPVMLSYNQLLSLERDSEVAASRLLGEKS